MVRLKWKSSRRLVAIYLHWKGEVPVHQMMMKYKNAKIQKNINAKKYNKT